MKRTIGIAASVVTIGCALLLGAGKLLAWYQTGSPAPTITLPAAVAADIGEPIQIDATTNGINIKWCSRSKYLRLIPNGPSSIWAVGKPDPNGNGGQYELEAWTALGNVPSEKSVCVVTIGKPLPPPPPPTPPDNLLPLLQSAYTADQAPNKAVYLERLAALYGMASDQGGTVYDTSMKTTTDIVNTMHSAVSSPLILGGNLQGLRQTITTELDSKLGTAVVALDQSKRDQIATQFKRISKLLGELK